MDIILKKYSNTGLETFYKFSSISSNYDKKIFLTTENKIFYNSFKLKSHCLSTLLGNDHLLFDIYYSYPKIQLVCIFAVKSNRYQTIIIHEAISTRNINYLYNDGNGKLKWTVIAIITKARNNCT